MFSDPVLSSLHVEVTTVQRSVLGTGWQAVSYSDDVSRLYYTESGEALVRHHGRDFHLRPGWAVVIPAHTVMSYQCPEQLVQHWVHFHAELFGGVDLFHYLKHSYEIEIDHPAYVFSILERLRCVFNGEQPGRRFETSGLLLQLLAPFVLARDSDIQRQQQEEVLKLRAVLEHIDSHLGEALPVADLAALAHQERTSFSRSFKHTFGVAPATYIRQKRVERAKRLLWETDDTLETMAESLGFSDGFHFSKVFKSIIGLSPKQFRLQPRQLP